MTVRESNTAEALRIGPSHLLELIANGVQLRDVLDSLMLLISWCKICNAQPIWCPDSKCLQWNNPAHNGASSQWRRLCRA